MYINSINILWYNSIYIPFCATWIIVNICLPPPLLPNPHPNHYPPPPPPSFLPPSSLLLLLLFLILLLILILHLLLSPPPPPPSSHYTFPSRIASSPRALPLSCGPLAWCPLSRAARVMKCGVLSGLCVGGGARSGWPGTNLPMHKWRSRFTSWISARMSLR